MLLHDFILNVEVEIYSLENKFIFFVHLAHLWNFVWPYQLFSSIYDDS